MAYPLTYSEPELAEYMRGKLREVADGLGWATTDHYQDAIDATLESYGVSQITDATQGMKLRSIATWQVWEAVVAATAGDFDYSADGGSYSRKQVHDHAVAQARKMKREAWGYLSPSDRSSGHAVPNQAVY